MNSEHAITSGRLSMLFWESTSRCNLACRHCRRVDVDGPTTNDLTTAEMKAVLASAAELGRPVVVFSGGEPLLRGDWEELGLYARSLGLPTALATNGTLVDDAVARRVAAAGFRRVSVSLDGADAATHDEFRGVAGAFDAAIRGMAALRRAGVAFQVNMTVARRNAGQLEAVRTLATELGACGVHLFMLVPVGCGAQIGPDEQLPPQEYERVLRWVYQRQAQGGLELRATCAPHYQRVAAVEARKAGADAAPTGGGHAGGHGSAAARRGCLCGVSVVFVGHSGEVFPCGYLPVSCGSVRRATLAEIWGTSGVLADLRDFDKLTGQCGRCGYKTVCGGCRARAFAATGDYLAEEPNCVMGKKA